MLPSPALPAPSSPASRGPVDDVAASLVLVLSRKVFFARARWTTEQDLADDSEETDAGNVAKFHETSAESRSHLGQRSLVTLDPDPRRTREGRVREGRKGGENVNVLGGCSIKIGLPGGPLICPSQKDYSRFSF